MAFIQKKDSDTIFFDKADNFFYCFDSTLKEVIL